MKQHPRLNPFRTPPAAGSELPMPWVMGGVSGEAVTALMPFSLGSRGLTPSSLFLGGAKYWPTFAQAATWPASAPTLTVWASGWVHTAALQSVR